MHVLDPGKQSVCGKIRRRTRCGRNVSGAAGRNNGLKKADGGNKEKEKEPSEVLSDFLNYIDRIRYEYKAAQEAVKIEDMRLQDFLHEMEFAEDKAERNRVATRLQRSRKERRRQKDEMKRLELIVQFFDDPNPKSTINKMRQILGKQRKQEEYLNGERHYNKRVDG